MSSRCSKPCGVDARFRNPAVLSPAIACFCSCLPPVVAPRMTPEQPGEALARHNPVDRIEPLARAGVPVLHIHGDQDTVVPLKVNSAKLPAATTSSAAS